MKKIIYPMATILLLANFSCQKSTDGNKSVIVEDSRVENTNEKNAISDTAITKSNADQNQMGEYTDRYVAEDGSSALVTFKKNEKENSISIRSNNKTIAAPKKAGAGIYGNYDFEIMVKNDSITITQGNNVIKLKKARGN